LSAAPIFSAESALALRAGSQTYRYDKQHLLPFADSLPDGTGWIGQKLGLGLNGLAPGGAGQAPLAVAGAKMALSICFEDLFDSAIAGQAAGAELIVNMSNFAWFAGS